MRQTLLVFFTVSVVSCGVVHARNLAYIGSDDFLSLRESAEVVKKEGICSQPTLDALSELAKVIDNNTWESEETVEGAEAIEHLRYLSGACREDSRRSPVVSPEAASTAGLILALNKAFYAGGRDSLNEYFRNGAAASLADSIQRFTDSYQLQIPEASSIRSIMWVIDLELALCMRRDDGLDDCFVIFQDYRTFMEQILGIGEGEGETACHGNIAPLTLAIHSYSNADVKYSRAILREIDDLILAWFKLTSILSIYSSEENEDVNRHRQAAIELLARPQRSILDFIKDCGEAKSFEALDLERLYPLGYVDQTYVNRIFSWCDRNMSLIGRLYSTPEIAREYQSLFRVLEGGNADPCDTCQEFLNEGKFDRSDIRLNFARTRTKEAAEEIRRQIVEAVSDVSIDCENLKVSVRGSGTRFLIYLGDPVPGQGVSDSCVASFIAELGTEFTADTTDEGRYNVGRDLYITRPPPLW